MYQNDFHDKLMEKVNTMVEQNKKYNIDIEELQNKISESTEIMKTIANLFSNTVWNLLPSTIKTYFEKYRNK